MSGISFSFGEFHLSPERKLLLSSGKPVRIGSRAFDLLSALVERSGETVTNQDLLKIVWPDTFVDEANLRVHMGAVRKVLHDGGGDTQWVLNVPGRGYRFTGPVIANVNNSASTASNVPKLLMPLVGRNALVETIAAESSMHRLLTLAGPAGIGKTSIALAVADQVSDSFSEALFFVDLAPLSAIEAVYSALSSVLGLTPVSGHALSAVIEYCRSRRLLFILDNCEHLIAEIAGLLETLLRDCPDLHIITTSREPLRSGGEYLVRIAPLEFPAETDRVETVAQIERYSAAQLFLERARASLNSFHIVDEDASALSQLCRRLDGLPLAIELAAGRLDLFSIQTLAEQLGESLELLTGKKRTSHIRHSALRTAFDWSFKLLNETAQVVFSRLSIFRSAFSQAAALAIVVDDVISAPQGLDSLAELAAKSFISITYMDGELSYRLLETARVYGSEKLLQSGDQPLIARRHARLWQREYESAEADWDRLTTLEWRSRYIRPLEDVRAALDWCFSEGGDALTGLEITWRTAPLWLRLSLLEEYLGRLKLALARLALVPLENRAQEMKLSIAFAIAIFNIEGPIPDQVEACRRAITIADALGDLKSESTATWLLYGASLVRADFGAADAYANRFSAIVAPLGTPTADAMGNRLRSLSSFLNGRFPEARRRAELATQYQDATIGGFRESAYHYDHRAASWGYLALALWAQGFFDQALSLMDRAVDAASSAADANSLCYVLSVLACPLAFLTHSYEAAHRYVDLLIATAQKESFAYFLEWGRSYERVLAIDGSVHPTPDVLLMLEFRRYGLFHRQILSTVVGENFDVPIRPKDKGASIWCTSELLRIEAEVLLKNSRSDHSRVEALLRESLSIASSQGALAWELRSATSLCRLLARKSISDARDVLEPVLERISEGFSTRDVREAASLLETLSV